MNIYRYCFSFAGRGESIVQFGEQALAAEESILGRCADKRCRQRPGCASAQSAQNLPPGRPRFGVAPQKLNAKVIEIGRDFAVNLAGLDWVARLLTHHHFKETAMERQPARP